MVQQRPDAHEQNRALLVEILKRSCRPPLLSQQHITCDTLFLVEVGAYAEFSADAHCRNFLRCSFFWLPSRVLGAGPVLSTVGPNYKSDGGAPTLHSKMYGCLYFFKKAYIKTKKNLLPNKLKVR